MRIDPALGLLLAAALFGCAEVEQTDTSSFAIAAPFTFAFEVSSMNLCSVRGENNEAPSPSNGTDCWVVFNRTASDNIANITGSDRFSKEGRFWIEGKGRVRSEVGGHGHLNNYTCEVEMTSVDVFRDLRVEPL